MAKGRCNFPNMIYFAVQVERDFGSVVTLQDQHVVCITLTGYHLRMYVLNQGEILKKLEEVGLDKNTVSNRYRAVSHCVYDVFS